MNPHLTMALTQAHQQELRHSAQTAGAADVGPGRATLVTRLGHAISTVRFPRDQRVAASTSATISS